MLMIANRRLAFLTLPLLIAGCSGGGGSGTTGPDGLLGVAALTGTDPRVVSLTEIAATEDGTQLTINFDGYDFVADDGFDLGRAVENGSTRGLLVEENLPNDPEMILFAGLYDDGTGATSVFYGLLGPSPENVPDSGTASWSGTSFAQLITASGTEDLGLGLVNVDAEFSGNVTADLSSLTGSVDAVTLGGMTISGNTFSGASVTTRKDGAIINVVGSSAVGASQGVFSGPTVADAPDETGGLFTLTGSDATLVGGFVAD